MVADQLTEICSDIIKFYSSNDLLEPNLYCPEGLKSCKECTDKLKNFIFEINYKKFILSNNYNNKTYRYLESYLATNFIREFLIKNLGFLEGNFLFLNPRKNRTFLPHLEFPLEFFKLLDLYPSEDMTITELSFRYFPNKQILFDILKNVIIQDDYIFPDIVGNNKVKLQKLFIAWIDKVITEKTFNKNTSKQFHEILSVLKNIYLIIDSLREDLKKIVNIDFKKEKTLWFNYIEYRLFEDMVNIAKSKQVANWRDTPSDFNERNEFLKFLKFRYPVTQIEKVSNTLWVEDGEISIIILEYYLANSITHKNIIQNGKILEIDPLSLNGLEYMGFVDNNGRYYTISNRAKRMARWIQKFLGIRTIDEVYRFYSDLSESKTWKWLYELGQENSKKQIIEEKSQNIINNNEALERNKLVRIFKEFVDAIFPFKENKRIIRNIEDIISSVPINIYINSFLRKYESIDRSLFSFSVTGILDVGEERSMGVFTGTCNSLDKIDGKTSTEFFQRREKVLRQINRLKIFLSTIGWPGLHLILEKEAREHEETNINAFLSHAFKRPATRANQIIKSLDDLKNNINVRKYLKNELQAPIEEILRLTRLLGFITTSGERKCIVKIQNYKQNKSTLESIIINKFLEVIEYIKLKGKQSDRDKIKKWFDESESNGIPMEKFLLETNIIDVIPKNIKLEFLFYNEDLLNSEYLSYNNKENDQLEKPDIILWDLIFPELLTNAIKFSNKFDPKVMIKVRVQRIAKKLDLLVYNNGDYVLVQQEFE